MSGSSECWVEGAAGSAYDVDHLPYAVVGVGGDEARVGVRIGERVLDVAAALDDLAELLRQPTLNPLMAAGPRVWASVRARVTRLLTDPGERVRVEPHLLALGDVETRMPFEMADYVDFYCSYDHASNVSRIFRPDNPALSPSWHHQPTGYHARAGTVVLSGTPITRPSGQRLVDGAVVFAPSERLDIEAELGFVVGAGAPSGRVSTAAFADHVFAVALVNDWSARDIQGFETVPLGPFLGKSFATSVSAWLTPLAALDAARVDLPGQDPAPLPHLAVDEPAGYDIAVEVLLDDEVISRPPYASTYWSPTQMLAHLTSNGASLRTGDLFASGTISGPGRDQRGSLLELSWGGAEPFTAGGRERTFLQDGDTVTLRATAPGALGGRLALGEVTGEVVAVG